ncbi:MAG: hypothetical protein WC593_01845 [Methanoregula sp.]
MSAKKDSCGAKPSVSPARDRGRVHAGCEAKTPAGVPILRITGMQQKDY